MKNAKVKLNNILPWETETNAAKPTQNLTNLQNHLNATWMKIEKCSKFSQKKSARLQNIFKKSIRCPRPDVALTTNGLEVVGLLVPVSSLGSLWRMALVLWQRGWMCDDLIQWLWFGTICIFKTDLYCIDLWWHCNCIQRLLQRRFSIRFVVAPHTADSSELLTNPVIWSF